MNSPKKISAVIFDLDGVLIDSEPLWSESRNMIFSKSGLTYTLADKKKTMGGDYKAGLKYLIRKYNLLITVDEFKQREQKILDELESKKLKLMPGVSKLLKSLDEAKLLRAIATSSFAKRLGFVKGILALTGFSAQVTGDEVKKGKPAPDIFLKVSEKLKVDPQNCVVLEDSKYGIKGARAARMKTVAVIDRRFSDKSDFTGEYQPDLMVNSLKEISVGKLEDLAK